VIRYNMMASIKSHQNVFRCSFVF